MRNFRNLNVWQQARTLTLEVFALSERLPDVDRYGLAAQLRRSANSIGANIAEGAGRPTRRDYARFLAQAMASSNELEHHLSIVDGAGLINGEEVAPLIDRCDQVRRRLVNLRSRILAET